MHQIGIGQPFGTIVLLNTIKSSARARVARAALSAAATVGLAWAVGHASDVFAL